MRRGKLNNYYYCSELDQSILSRFCVRNCTYPTQTINALHLSSNQHTEWQIAPTKLWSHIQVKNKKKSNLFTCARDFPPHFHAKFPQDCRQCVSLVMHELAYFPFDCPWSPWQFFCYVLWFSATAQEGIATQQEEYRQFSLSFPQQLFLPMLLLLLLLLLALSCCSGRARNIKNNICSWPSLSQLSIYAPGCGRGRRTKGQADRGTDGWTGSWPITLEKPQHFMVSLAYQLTPSPRELINLPSSRKSHCKQLIKLLRIIDVVSTSVYPVNMLFITAKVSCMTFVSWNLPHAHIPNL